MNHDTMFVNAHARTPVVAQKAAVAPPALNLDASATPTYTKRCAVDGCRKKLTIMDYDCDKCKSRYCGSHRLPELHTCSHDYRGESIKLERVVADKLTRI